MPNAICAAPPEFFHSQLPGGVELAAEVLPARQTVALYFRVLAGVVDDPAEQVGLGALVERTLSKGTARYSGRALADAFDLRGAQWSTGSGRQSTLVRAVCLPEFVEEVVALVAEMLRHPQFPEDACRVALELTQQELKHLEDEPHELIRMQIQELTLGPLLGRYPNGSPETIARIAPADFKAHWQRVYHAGRIQVVAAGPVDATRLANVVDGALAGLGDATPAARAPVSFEFRPARAHRAKELEQQYIAITLPGLSRHDPDFAVEQVLLGVLSGGMSGRLFTEVREKLGLVYWVGAWHEQPRGAGIIHLGASTTPQRCRKTYDTLLRELERLGRDLTATETDRARDSLIAQHETEDDLTGAHAAGLSDDLFHFGRPIGGRAKLDALRKVDVARVTAYARRLPLDRLCIATLGPAEL